MGIVRRGSVLSPGVRVYDLRRSRAVYLRTDIFFTNRGPDDRAALTSNARGRSLSPVELKKRWAPALGGFKPALTDSATAGSPGGDQWFSERRSPGARLQPRRHDRGTRPQRICVRVPVTVFDGLRP